MSRLRDAARNGLTSCRVLGIPAASKLHMLKVHPRASRNQAPIRVPVPGIPDGLWVRPRGTDLPVVLQTFEKRAYALDWCPPYPERIRGLCARAVAEGRIPLIIDVGANIGASTRLFAESFPECHVYAVEPEQGNFDMLCMNTEMNERITLFRAALWDQPTKLSQIYEGSGWACRIQEGDGGVAPTPCITIPELLALDPRMRPVIVKIDIEGAERFALRSNTRWVHQVPLMVYEQHDGLFHWLGKDPGCGDAFEAALHGKRWARLRLGENDYAFMHPDDIGASLLAA